MVSLCLFLGSSGTGLVRTLLADIYSNGVLNFMSANGNFVHTVIANNYTRRHWETLMGSHGMGEFAKNLCASPLKKKN
jgi:hypothetical protein